MKKLNYIKDIYLVFILTYINSQIYLDLLEIYSKSNQSISTFISDPITYFSTYTFLYIKLLGYFTFMSKKNIKYNCNKLNS